MLKTMMNKGMIMMKMVTTLKTNYLDWYQLGDDDMDRVLLDLAVAVQDTARIDILNVLL